MKSPKPIASAKTRQRRFGAYYTPRSAADLMADWVVRRSGDVVLEPSFGDGAFIRALDRSVEARGLEAVQVVGVELDEQAVLRLDGVSPSLGVTTVRSDFLRTDPGLVDGVVGNPPYVRLRHLKPGQRDQALDVAQRSLGHAMATSGSLWMPFVLHAVEALRPGGRLALVLPYELTYVRYALPLWRKLAESFRSLAVERSRERLFPDVMQEVVILYADGYGGRTDTVDFRAFDTVGGMVEGRPGVERTVSVRDILAGERVFVRALLSDELTQVLDRMLPAQTVPLERLATIRIGYVSGDKTFFHPDPGTVARYSIRPENLVEAITSTKALAKSGVRSSTVPSESVSTLFLPREALTRSEAAYVAQGEAEGVQNQYKCRIRSPWYAVPGVRTPELILSVFSERPVVMVNDAGYAASNSLLCGYLKPEVRPEAVVTAWYTSLTLLQCELEIHALGGGVLVLIPGEANKIRLPRSVRADERHLSDLDDLLSASKTNEAYSAGDPFVLEGQLGMSQPEIALVRQGVETLVGWRTAHRG